MEFSTTTAYPTNVTTVYSTTTGESFTIDRDGLYSRWISANSHDDTAITHTIDVGDLTEAEEDRIVDKLIQRIRQEAKNERESKEAFKDYMKDVLGI